MIPDHTSLECHCQFFRRYLLPCKHLFHRNIAGDFITDEHWWVFVKCLKMSMSAVCELLKSTHTPFSPMTPSIAVGEKNTLCIVEVDIDTKTHFISFTKIIEKFNDAQKVGLKEGSGKKQKKLKKNLSDYKKQKIQLTSKNY